ncbi:MAG: hypothetical protein V1827_04465 [Candidatus Micrarchaeota archaeon]
MATPQEILERLKAKKAAEAKKEAPAPKEAPENVVPLRSVAAVQEPLAEDVGASATKGKLQLVKSTQEAAEPETRAEPEAEAEPVEEAREPEAEAPEPAPPGVDEPEQIDDQEILEETRAEETAPRPDGSVMGALPEAVQSIIENLTARVEWLENALMLFMGADPESTVAMIEQIYHPLDEDGNPTGQLPREDDGSLTYPVAVLLADDAHETKVLANDTLVPQVAALNARVDLVNGVDDRAVTAIHAGVPAQEDGTSGWPLDAEGNPKGVMGVAFAEISENGDAVATLKELAPFVTSVKTISMDVVQNSLVGALRAVPLDIDAVNQVLDKHGEASLPVLEKLAADKSEAQKGLCVMHDVGAKELDLPHNAAKKQAIQEEIPIVVENASEVLKQLKGGESS